MPQARKTPLRNRRSTVRTVGCPRPTCRHKDQVIGLALPSQFGWCLCGSKLRERR